MYFHSLFPSNKSGISLTICLFLASLTYFLINLLISILIMHHSFPLSIYPAFSAFIIGYFLFNGEIPSRSKLAIFIIVYMVFEAILIWVLSITRDFVPARFLILLEPVLFFPAAILFYSLRGVISRETYFTVVIFVVGLLMLIIDFISLFPGNMVTSYFLNVPGGNFNFIDTRVPSVVVYNLYLYYIIPIFAFVGCAALILGIAHLHLKIRIRDVGFYYLLFGIILSLFTFGTALIWIYMTHSIENKNATA